MAGALRRAYRRPATAERSSRPRRITPGGFTALPGQRLVLGLGLAGSVAVVAVPFFEYPANPLAVGAPATNERTLLWVAAVLRGPAFVALTEWSTRGSTPVPETVATTG